MPALLSGKYEPHSPGREVKQWADELGVDLEPKSADEKFFELCMLELGDPTMAPDRWPQFHELRAKFFSLPPCHPRNSPAEEDARAIVMLQYILWYQREKDKLNTAHS